MGSEQHQGNYALVQYCPMPERLEFLNIGLLLVVPDLDFFRVRFARGHGRLDRVFGKQSKFYLDALKFSFDVRLRSEFSEHFDSARFDEFAEKRANDIRLSRLLPVLVSDVEPEFERLFLDLVGDDDPVVREPRIRRKLREAFVSHRVEALLDNPDDVELPEYGLKISVPYGYQNGCYNFIDGMRLSANVGEGLREAGKRALEGGLIWKHFQDGPPKRLVVVGDFSRQSNEFFHAVKGQFEESNVKLHRLDDMRPLLKDIVEHVETHGQA